MTLLQLPTIEVRGTPTQMGQAHGEAERERLRAFVNQRKEAYLAYSAERRSPAPSLDEFVRAGAACLDVAASWDPEGAQEHRGIAAGAGIDPHELYAVTNMTDVRDILLLGGGADEEGCTAILVPPELSADNTVIAGQTWDLNPQDLDFVVAVHRRPAEGPDTWSVTCVGCLTLVGMNEHGLSVGTTNIKVSGSRVGVGYLSMLHRLVRAQSLAEAAELIEQAPRSAAHTYWVANADGAFEYEVSAKRALKRPLEQTALVRTNHCLHEPHVPLQGEPTNSSSAARLKRMSALLSAGGQGVESVRDAFADRTDGVDSISRFPEDEQGTATNSVVITVPARRELWACKGPVQRGEWVQLKF